MNIALHTFGGSQAARNLACILNEFDKPRMTNKVARLLSEYGSLTNQMDVIHDNRCYRHLMHLLRDEFLEKLDIANLPESVITHAQNVVGTFYKIKIREREEI